MEGDEGSKRDVALVLNVARDGISSTDKTLGIEDIGCLYAVCDTRYGRLRIEFDGEHGKALRMTVDGMDGRTAQVVPKQECFLVSFGIYEEFGELFEAIDLGEPLEGEGWREVILENSGTKPFLYIRTDELEELVYMPPKEGGIEAFCLHVRDLLVGGGRDGNYSLCVIHFPKRYAGFTALGYSEETFEIAYNGPMSIGRHSLTWGDYDLAMYTSNLAGGCLIDLQVAYRETGYTYYDLEPVLMKPEERFWLPITHCDGYEEYWDLIVSSRAIDPLDWIEGFERVGNGAYRCTEIDRVNSELFESYPFRG